MREKRLKKNEMSALSEIEWELKKKETAGKCINNREKGSEKARCCIRLLEKDMSLPEEMNDMLKTFRSPVIEQKIVFDSIEDIYNLNFK